MYLLDFYLKQDQEENAKQLHSFVKQTRDTANAKTYAKEKLEIQLMSDNVHCQKNALKTYNAYFQLIQKVAPDNHGKPMVTESIHEEAKAILVREKSECQKIHDAKLIEGI